MKTFAFTALWISAVFLVTVSQGCYESPVVTWYESHVYKGAGDPLLGKLRTDDLQKKLEERFSKVQTDR